jgi:hypothetical protein
MEYGPRRRRTDTRRSTPSPSDPYPSIDAITAHAHALFVAEGRHVDRLQTYWKIAEQELLERAASRAISAHDCPRPPFA